MPECQDCGEWVSATWARVFSDPENGDVRGCLECSGEGRHGGVGA